MRALTKAAVAAGLAALLAAPAFAQVVNRYQVASHAEGRGYPRSLHVVITSPPEYVLDSMGRFGNDASWRGPRYQATGLASLGGDSSLGWSAGIYRAPSTRETILANLVHDWAPVQEGAEEIERRVGGRDAAPVPGTWVLTQGTPMAGEARYEAGVVFPLCGRTALVLISALLPSGDSAGGSMGFGEYRIEGRRPTEWNRAKVLETIQGLSLEGSLPARRITVDTFRQTVTGTVADCNGGPVATERVRLERRVGRRWVRGAAGRTTATGTFKLTARPAGTYRVVSGTARSATFRVR